MDSPALAPMDQVFVDGVRLRAESRQLRAYSRQLRGESRVAREESQRLRERHQLARGQRLPRAPFEHPPKTSL